MNRAQRRAEAKQARRERRTLPKPKYPQVGVTKEFLESINWPDGSLVQFNGKPEVYQLKEQESA